MATELNKEQFESLPDFLKDDYQEFDGVYKHAGMMIVKKTLNDLDGRNKELTSKLDGYEERKALEIEEAKSKALEEAKSSKDIEAIERQYQEQMEDLKKRTADETRAAVLSEVKIESAKKEAESIAKEITAKLSIDGAEEDLNILVGMRIKADESGNIVFYNRDGSASAMTKEQFIEDVKNKHPKLVKAAVTTTGGGYSKGSNIGGASGEAKGFIDMTPEQKVEYLRSNPPKRK